MDQLPVTVTPVQASKEEYERVWLQVLDIVARMAQARDRNHKDGG